jgi:predicted ATPase/DNA-binding XRE family transcriptional regulator
VDEAFFGEWLKRQRSSRGLTQKQLAQQIGCAAITLRKIESGERHPSVQIAKRIAEIFQISSKEEKDFLRFSRGDWQSMPDADYTVTPWRASYVQAEKQKETITPRNNLPMQLTSFIGRKKEQDEIQNLLVKNRLVTLAGIGGIGKTRLSLQTAHELLNTFPDGVWFIEFSLLSDPALVTQTVAKTLGLIEQADRSPEMALNDFLQWKSSLLILDNCEHLIQVCAGLAEALLQHCSDLHILATSREALGIYGEAIYLVPPLSTPNPSHLIPDTLLDYEAARLFMERGELAQPHFAITNENVRAVAQICHQLDGIPLAIELAAARLKMLSAEQISSRLDDRFRLLTSGSRTALPRQQTLRAVIDWSYDLLSQSERVLLHRLAVFSGGCTLEAAEQVCAGVGQNVISSDDMLDLLAHLVEKSLLAVEEHPGHLRYRILETVRQYAREKLKEAGEEEQFSKQHLYYFLKLAEDEEPNLYGGRQLEWIIRLEEEHSNYQIALAWSLENDVEAGQRLALVLWWSWVIRGYVSEGYSWILKALTAHPDMPDPARAKLLSAAAYMAGYIDLKSRKAFIKQSVALFRKLNDEIGLAVPLICMGYDAYFRFDYDQACVYFEDGRKFFEKGGNKWGIRIALGTLGMVNEAQGEFEKAKTLYENSLTLSREIGDFDGITWGLLLLGTLAVNQGEYSKAMGLLSEGLSYAKMAKNKPNIGSILTQIGIAASQTSNIEQARSVFEESLSMYREMGNPIGTLKSMRLLGYIARLDGDYTQARSLFVDSLKLAFQLKDKNNIGLCLIYIGELTLAQRHPEEFVHLLGMAESILPNNWRQGMPPYFRSDIQMAVDSARATLGEQSFIAAWAEGRAMTMEQAINYALE